MKHKGVFEGTFDVYDINIYKPRQLAAELLDYTELEGEEYYIAEDVFTEAISAFLLERFDDIEEEDLYDNN